MPTPGHTAGHQSLMLLEGSTYNLFVGDAVFDLERAPRSDLSGVAEDLDSSRQSVETIRRQLDAFHTVLAPAHDHGVRDGSRFPAHRH